MLHRGCSAVSWVLKEAGEVLAEVPFFREAQQGRI